MARLGERRMKCLPCCPAIYAADYEIDRFRGQPVLGGEELGQRTPIQSMKQVDAADQDYSLVEPDISHSESCRTRFVSETVSLSMTVTWVP